MSELSNSLRACANGQCDERCGRYYYGDSCRSVLMSDAAKALDEWEGYAGFLAAHGMFKVIDGHDNKK